MEQRDILILLAGLGIFAALGLRMWLLMRDPDRKAPKLMGPATVISLDVEYRHGWIYTGTFALSDGEELRLHMLPYRYDSLRTGQTGLLTWQGETLTDFEPDDL